MNLDPQDFFADVLRAREEAKRNSQEMADLTRRLLNNKNGRRWLTLLMARHNYMGSVFSASDSMSPQAAAYRDGARAVISEILNDLAKP